MLLFAAMLLLATAPPSTPAKTGYGATILHAPLRGAHVTGETGWNVPGAGATGGGVPVIFGFPSFQKNVPGIISAGRNVADLAFDAPGQASEALHLNGARINFEGTTMAAPMFGAAQHVRGVVHGAIPPYYAGAQYDHMTGIGVLQATNFAALLQHERATSAPRAPCPATQCIYVVNAATNGSVSIYPINASGNVKPYRTITGTRTGLQYARGIAVDAQDNVYVSTSPLTDARSTLSVFSAEADGDIAPLRTIAGGATGLVRPYSIAVDADGNVYAGNSRGRCHFVCMYGGAVTEYAAGQGGDIAPIRIIRGKKTEMWGATHIALDEAGDVYDAPYRECDGTYCVGRDEIIAFTTRARGNSPPSSEFGFLGPADSIAVDDENRVYVAYAEGAGAIYVYPATNQVNDAPIQIITGSQTGLQGPTAVAVDSARNIYVANFNNNSITVYAAGATGNVTPEQVIIGSNTGIAFPFTMAVR